MAEQDEKQPVANEQPEAVDTPADSAAEAGDTASDGVQDIADMTPEEAVTRLQEELITSRDAALRAQEWTIVARPPARRRPRRASEGSRWTLFRAWRRRFSTTAR